MSGFVYTPRTVAASILAFLGVPPDKQFQCPEFCYHPAGDYVEALLQQLVDANGSGGQVIEIVGADVQQDGVVFGEPTHERPLTGVD